METAEIDLGMLVRRAASIAACQWQAWDAVGVNTVVDIVQEVGHTVAA